MEGDWYQIDLRNKELYFPRVDRWVMDTFHLSLQETMLYGLILIKGFMVWNYEYIAQILAISKPTVFRLVDRLVKKKVIEKRVKYYKGNVQRSILVGLYTIEGHRPQAEIEELFIEGEKKLNKYYKT